MSYNGKTNGVITISNVRLSYQYLTQMDAKENKYKTSLIIDAKDAEALKNDIREAFDRSNVSFKGNFSNSYYDVIRNGDDKGDPAYEGCIYINAKNTKKPTLKRLDGSVIDDPNEIYSGCYGTAFISFYFYSVNGKKGISCCIHGFIKTADGENLAGTNPDVAMNNYINSYGQESKKNIFQHRQQNARTAVEMNDIPFDTEDNWNNN